MEHEQAPGVGDSKGIGSWLEVCRGRGRTWCGGAVIFVLALAAYWPALRGEFVWDDRLLVLKNPLVTGEYTLLSLWFRTDFPVALIWLWVEWLLWGAQPAGYHVVNVLLHGLGALLLWGVLTRLKVPGGWLAAVLFTVHPVAAASVAWISELKNTLSLPFYLLSLLWYLRFEESRMQSRKPGAYRWYGLSIGTFLLALFSKTSTVMLPVVLLGCAWWQRGRFNRKDLMFTIPFFVLSLVMGCMTIWFQAGAIETGDLVQTENFWGRVAIAGRAMWFYLGKAVMPMDLSMIYPRWQMDAADVRTYLPALAWLGVLGLCWAFRKTWGRGVFFCLATFTVTLFPVSGFFSMSFLAISRVSDHLQYLPLTSIVALIGAALWKLFRAPRLQILPILLVLALFMLTMRRAQVIATDETLWRDTLARNPTAWTAHNNLGCVLAAQKKYEQAIKEFEAALQLNPRNAGAHGNLARVLALRGDFSEAEAHFATALEIKPTDMETQVSYASTLAQQGKVAEAIGQLRTANAPRHEIGPAMMLATLLFQTGRLAEAAAQYRRVLEMQPDQQEALNNLAWLLATSPDAAVRNGPDAVRFAEHACRLTAYTNALPIGTLAAAYAEVGRFSDAVDTATKAINLAMASGNPRFAEINRQLQNMYRSGVPYREPSSR